MSLPSIILPVLSSLLIIDFSTLDLLSLVSLYNPLHHQPESEQLI